MGWKWEDDGEPSDSLNSGRGFGELVNPNPRSSVEDRCSTRRIVKSSCRTEEVEPGRFIRKCDKTEEILRDCIGRPREVVESKTEHTEEDVTDEVTHGDLRPFGSSEVEPFNFPGLRSDIDSIERSLFGGLGHFLEAAEGMANEFFQSFNGPSRRSTDSSPFGRRMPFDGPHEKNSSKELEEEPSTYSDLSGELRDV